MNQKVVNEYKLKPFGAKGWYSSADFVCPICGKYDKFGVKFVGKGGTVHCFYENHRESLWSYLKRANKTHLLNVEMEVEITDYISENLFAFEIKPKNTEYKPISKPMGSKLLPKNDPYLDSRKFNQYHYEYFEPSYSLLHPKLDKNYIIFMLYMHGNLVGWLARSRFSKKWHKQNLENYKKGLEPLKLRYYNHSSVEFNKILGGYDQITENTHTLIIVEGIFDYSGVCSELGLDDQEEIKCCFTFGDTISQFQVDLIKGTNIKNVYLMYDYNTINESRAAGLNLNGIDNVKICEIDRDADPNELTANEMIDLIANAKDFLYFYVNRVDIKFAIQ